MPVIFVMGIGSESSRDFLLEIHDACKRTAMQVPELHLRSNQVSVFFPSDLLGVRSESERVIIAFVVGLYDRPERTPKVIQSFATILGIQLAQFFPKALVEVIIQPTNPELTWTSAK